MARSNQRQEISRPAGRSRDLDRGHAAYRRRAWQDAYEALHRADQAEPLGVDDLELLAVSAGLSGEYQDLIATLERVYQAHHDAGDNLRAARAAFWLGLRLMSSGEGARGTGWFSRAQRAVEQAACDCVERGYLLLPIIHRNERSGDYGAALEAASAAVEIAEEFGDIDLAAFARNFQGRAMMKLGRVEEGLTLLDEAMVAAAGGELSPIITGLTYCSVIAACQQVYALDRAREWTAALAEWCGNQPQLVSFAGTCLVHRSEIMQLRGDWSEAINEARMVSERRGDRDAVAAAFYQEAEVHRLRGEFAEAEEGYRKASESGEEPQPGLALLRAAQGRIGDAAAAIRRACQAQTEPLRRARFLPALVEIMLATGRTDEARAGAEELARIATRYDTEVLNAMADHASGAVDLAEGKAEAAVLSLRRAFGIWHKLEAPYLAARIRVLIGKACAALGDEEGAALERDSARVVFERLGAAPDLAGLVSSADHQARGRYHGLTQRELQVLKLIASGKTNKAIAKSLFLSEKTIDRHVSNIFVKLDVPTRAAATAYAYENRLV